ncbi:hypothetical protein EB796_023115 [Bugula neritina]|uniref:XK-related protein n=1 Tax=Bugula neritina TaxID=10212 RepID=A0A7J7IYR0_BUGNE|nr:hypothetical protein EB796_023115 [Bugula neritina]
MLGPVVRYIDTIIYGVRSRQKGISPERRQYFHDQMQFERVDGAMLRLFEAFLRVCAPVSSAGVHCPKKWIRRRERGQLFFSGCYHYIDSKFYDIAGMECCGLS